VVEDTEPDCYYKFALYIIRRWSPLQPCSVFKPGPDAADPTASTFGLIRSRRKCGKAKLETGNCWLAQSWRWAERNPGSCGHLLRFPMSPLRSHLGNAQERACAVLGWQATLFHRSFPIESVHPWARSASVLTNCAHTRIESSSWDLRICFMPNKQSSRTQSLSEVSHSYLQAAAGFRMRRLLCLRYPRAWAERDLAADIGPLCGWKSKVRQPCFINGFRIDGVPSPQQLRTVLREAVAASADSRQTRAAIKPDVVIHSSSSRPGCQPSNRLPALVT